MNEAARVAFIHSQSVSMRAELEAMVAENFERACHKRIPAYHAHDFRALPGRYGLTENQVIAFLMGQE